MKGFGRWIHDGTRRAGIAAALVGFAMLMAPGDAVPEAAARTERADLTLGPGGSGTNFGYSVTSVDFPMYSDREIANHAMAELAKKGEVRQQNFVTVGLGRPGGQMNIYTPNGRVVRAAVYMGGGKLVIAQSDAPPSDAEALVFEQSIVLVNGAGNDIDRVNPNNNGETRKYDCR